MLKNYFIYEINGKIKRQAINLNDIYPEGYALNKIPDESTIIARIITSDTVNKRWAGHMVKYIKTSWMKCNVWTSFYPGNLTIQFKDAILYHKAQSEFINKYIPLITANERELLKDSTNAVILRMFNL